MLVPTSQHDFHIRIIDNAVSTQVLQILTTIYTIYFVLHSKSAFTLQFQVSFLKTEFFKIFLAILCFLWNHNLQTKELLRCAAT